MGQLVSITVKEFKQNPFEIMDICTEVCMVTCSDCVLMVLDEKKGIYQEIARVERAGRGIRYIYNTELMRKLGISIDPKRDKVEKIMAYAFDQVGFFSGSMKPEILKSKFKQAIDLVYEEFAKLMG